MARFIARLMWACREQTRRRVAECNYKFSLSVAGDDEAFLLARRVSSGSTGESLIWSVAQARAESSAKMISGTGESYPI